MGNHSFVAYRNDGDQTEARVRFDEDSLRYVPIRLPWTICVQQSLPPGAAGVLVNQTHVFPDLFVIVNAPQKQIYEAVDGHRSIAEIIEGVNESNTSAALEFFENLWQHDQVVFDTSKKSVSG
jgi:hypothetical protein